jgi:fucose 4-O-acetylase-like acetyltransferase
MEIKKQRIEWIDALKGLAIILVVFGHIADGYISANLYSNSKCLYSIYYCVYSFHMPLFFMLSGVTFALAYYKNCTFNVFKIKCQLLNFVWIYVVFSTVQWIFQYVFSDYVNTVYSVKDLLLIFIKPVALYWYLYVLFFIYIISIFLLKRIEIKILVVTSGIVSFLISFLKFGQLYIVKHIIYFSAFFILGIFIAYNMEMFNNLMLLITQGVGACAIFTIIVLKNCAVGYWGHYIVALVPCIFLICCFSSCRALYKNKVLIICGKCSLEIYLLHCYITAANRKILLEIGVSNFYLNVLLNLILAVVIPLFVTWLLEKINIKKYVFGLGAIVGEKIFD